jgi:ABC-type polysaccharide/polyol phosphate export permease
MIESLKELFQYRELLWALTTRNIKIKYKQTVMGFMWALFMPTVIVLSGIVVKLAMSMMSGKPLEASGIVAISVKALPWAFFVGSLKFAVNSLTSNMDLVQKIYFPRELFPFSYILSQLLDFLVATLALAIIFVFVGIGFSVYILWLPFLILLIVLFTTGLALLFSCANLFFRDVKYIVEVILTFGIFFTPVFYEAKIFGKWGTLLLLNPVGSMLEGIYQVVALRQAPDYYWLAYSTIWAIGGLVIGWIVFKKSEPSFAENI